jgi:hypothetical protein
VADVIIPVRSPSPLETLVPAIAATDALLSRLVGQLGETAGKRMVMLEQLRSAAGGHAKIKEEVS